MVCGALLVALPVGWMSRKLVFDWIKAPFDVACIEFANAPCALNYPSPTAGFSAYLAIAFATAAALVLPVLVYHVWAFVAPGLYQHERRVLLPLVLGSVLLFIAGTWLCRSFVLPRAFLFLLQNSPGTPMIMVDDYLAFFVRLALAFGVTFELPIVVLVLAMAGLVNHRQLLRVWRYAVVVAFVLAAVLTPPDLASQFALASALCGLYALSVGLAWAVGRKGPPSDSALTVLVGLGSVLRICYSARPWPIAFRPSTDSPMPTRAGTRLSCLGTTPTPTQI